MLRQRHDSCRFGGVAVDATTRYRSQASMPNSPHLCVLEKVVVLNMIDMPLDDKVFTALERSQHVLGHNLRFATERGHVTLKGEVTSYYQKQMAQEAIRYVDGVREIHNELEVTTNV